MRLALLLSLVLAGCTPTAAEVALREDRAALAAAALDRTLSGYVPAEPQDCLGSIDRRVSNGSRTIGGTILYRVGRDFVRNDMNGNCDFRNDPILVTQTPSTQLCRGDIVQLIDRNSRFPMGSCSYGDFVTYRRARR